MKNPPGWNPEGFRGADGNRNHDLFDANEALYQLSYSPWHVVLHRRTTLATIVRSLPKRKSGCHSCCAVSALDAFFPLNLALINPTIVGISEITRIAMITSSKLSCTTGMPPKK